VLVVACVLLIAPFYGRSLVTYPPPESRHVRLIGECNKRGVNKDISAPSIAAAGHNVAIHGTAFPDGY
jgi:hypothetical protein